MSGCLEWCSHDATSQRTSRAPPANRTHSRRHPRRSRRGTPSARPADVFGVSGVASPLVSERDQNVTITTDDGRGFVLKIGNPADETGVIDMQTQGLLHVARTDPTLPADATSSRTLEGTFQAGVTGPDGRAHIVRMVTLLPGRTMEPDELRLDTLYSFGVTCARLGRALRGFFHPSAGHPLLWNIKHALSSAPLVHHIPDEPVDDGRRGARPVRGTRGTGLRRPAGPGDPQRPDVRQLPVRCRTTGLGDRRLRRHGAFGADLRLRLHGRGLDG